MDSSPLLPFTSPPSPSAAVDLVGVVDHRGRPASRSSSGKWTAALFIIGVEIAERFAYYGISSNLITYLTGPLQESTAAAAAGVNTWSGVAMMLPLAGAFIADSYLGRYRTVLFASLLYILGLGLLTLSSVLPILHPTKCSITDGKACSPNHFQIGFFYFALYLVALAQGGHKPCAQAFGADQFDEKDPVESISRSSFFNWWYCGLCLGGTVTIIILSYVQDNISWALGFGIPFIAMGLALILFLLGTKTYRFYQMEGESPFRRIGKSLVALVKSRMVSSHASSVEGADPHRYKFAKDEAANGMQIEEAEGVLQLVPIWATCLIYAVVFAQSSTFFTKQGSTLDRRIGSSFQVPPAALQSFISITIVAFIPIYDRILVPISRKFSRIPTGITQLQRIGIGMILSIISMAIAAIVEVRRLKTAKEYGLIDQPKTTIPMSLWWLVPQYILYGITEVFIMVGLQEFFYDQVPDALRSLGLALYLTIFGIGNFISSFAIAVIDEATSKSGESWFSDNLNRAHLDYFYWLLAGLSTVGLIIYLYSARSYSYKKKQNIAA
ncbi:protein NRT1/ PTR FAMILY 5.10-like [Dendrobium catenatum]|uniref:protein NRT1/ PTR FAMILY 5.10-like n=1 Tax=Dendrobium catenatum TaxID=906689 RepID=UPI0009F4CE5C|nr:protein NRT1/ PTR FAMILY 5.10-like [Dendrobium catenatum]